MKLSCLSSYWLLELLRLEGSNFIIEDDSFSASGLGGGSAGYFKKLGYYFQ